MDNKTEETRKWFKEARKGLFVHWGLYSSLAGKWKEEEIPWLGEWIMHTAKIPAREYERLASGFNPVKFNAREWVSLAEDAEMKYIVFTAKHHDGFAMFNSRADKFNIVDATPFKRDPVAELAEACKGTNVKLALYYSQAMDWHEPSAGNAPYDMNYGNTWDFQPGTAAGFSEYIEEKAKPQIRELLTQYGPVAMMWFDNPLPSFTMQHAKDIKKLVKKIQPNCLINSRIGHNLGDVVGWGDSELPRCENYGLAEACISLNDTWGYKTDGGRWKTPEEVREMAEYANQRGANLLINVGPKSDGRFPDQAVDILKKL